MWTELIEDDDDENTPSHLVSGSFLAKDLSKFMAHLQGCFKLLTPTDILAGKVKDCETRETVPVFWTVLLCYELKDACDKNDKKFDDKVNNFLRFAMDNFDTELVVYGI